MRVTAIPTQTERKRLGRSVPRAEERHNQTPMPHPQGAMRQLWTVTAQRNLPTATKPLIRERDQASMQSNGRSHGECRGRCLVRRLGILMLSRRIQYRLTSGTRLGIQNQPKNSSRGSRCSGQYMNSLGFPSTTSNSGNSISISWPRTLNKAMKFIEHIGKVIPNIPEVSSCPIAIQRQPCGFLFISDFFVFNWPKYRDKSD